MGNPTISVLKISSLNQSLFDAIGYPPDMCEFVPELELPVGVYDPPNYNYYLTKEWLKYVSASMGGRHVLEKTANLPNGFLTFFNNSDMSDMNPIYRLRIIKSTSIPFGEKYGYA